MTAFIPALLAVMLLDGPDAVVDAAAAAAISEDANRVEIRGQGEEPKVGESLKVTSRSSDFDRREGVVMFEGDVVVQYANDCTMCSDRLYLFLAGSNELSRVVALGNVSITNDTRTGTCPMATYRRRKNEIEMRGNATGGLAKLVEQGNEASALEGTRIRFWLDSEQVEVEDSRILTDRKEGLTDSE